MTTLATAGHVDHGKTTLVRALTGVDCDRLPEERRRGMTIDLAAAPWTLGSGRRVGIVDVPGHHRLVRTMAAGATGVDAVLLVVAADGGVMPQTEEHLAVCEVLGAQAGIVALTRCDLVDDDLRDLAAAEVVERLVGTAFEGAPVVPVSAVTGAGLAELDAAVEATLVRVVPRPDLGRPRLWVERAFAVPGHGPVVTGTLEGGTLHVGDTVTLLPGGLRARVRGLQQHGNAENAAHPGERTAVNLAGVELAALHRGQAVVLGATVATTARVDARLRRPRGAVAPLLHGATVQLLAGTAAVSATVRLLDADEVQDGVVSAQLHLDRPLPLLPGDRIVLRAESGTAGGGTIVDIAPRRHRRHDADATAALASLEGAGPDVLVTTVLGRAVHGSTAADIGRRAGLGPARAAECLRVAVGDGTALPVGRRWITPERLLRLGARSDAALAAAAEADPLRDGVPREEWRTRMRLPADVAPDVAHHLHRAGRIVEQGALVRLPGAHPAVAEADAHAVALAARLDAAGLEPPSLTDLRAEGLDGPTLRHLVATGRAVRLGEDVVLGSAAYRSAVDAVTTHLATYGPATVAALRDAAGTSRRVMVPLLERLDAERRTRRDGDLRRLRVGDSTAAVSA